MSKEQFVIQRSRRKIMLLELAVAGLEVTRYVGLFSGFGATMRSLFIFLIVSSVKKEGCRFEEQVPSALRACN